MLRTLITTTFMLLCFCLVLPVQAQKNSTNPDINKVNFYFPKNAYKFKVSSEIKDYVQELKDFMEEHEDYTIKLDGFAQDGSNNEWNTRVSKYRVRAVRDLLIENGIKTDKIRIEYFGKTSPIAEDETSRELAKNRRVELRVLQEG